MKNLYLMALLGLGWVGLSTAHAQFYYVRPMTNPTIQSPYSPYGMFYYGPNTLVGPTGRPIISQGYPPFGINSAVTSVQGPGAGPAGYNPLVLAPGAADSAARGSQTGHSTAFQAYRGYFMNYSPIVAPDGGVTNPVAQGTNPALAPVVGTGLSRFTTPGKRPPRGKENTARDR